MIRRIHPFLGDWQIVQMELWDRDYIDLEGPAHVRFDPDCLGSFHFGAVRGWLDYRVTDSADGLKVEFSWEGFNDADPSCGRGWAMSNEDRLIGRLYIHNGDDSAFVAERMERRARLSKSPSVVFKKRRG